MIIEKQNKTEYDKQNAATILKNVVHYRNEYTSK